MVWNHDCYPYVPLKLPGMGQVASKSCLTVMAPKRVCCWSLTVPLHSNGPPVPQVGETNAGYQHEQYPQLQPKGGKNVK